MPKTTSFTTFTPLPAGITRPSVMDMLHDHVAMIDLNPLVKERCACETPKHAPAGERDSKWYIIKDKVSVLPVGLATGSLSYHACFRSLADGVHTHIYAPLGLDIQAKWTLGGHLPGEPRPPPLEPPLTPPKNGLYIREDVKMTCSSLLMGFVKKTFKESHARFLNTLVERAHILESNFANERLKALRKVDPNIKTAHGNIVIAPPPDYRAKAHSPGIEHHTRSQSDPLLSPDFSQSSTLADQSDDLRSPASSLTSSSKPSPRPAFERSMTIDVATEASPSSLSPRQASPFLLPATTFDGGFSRRHQRPMTLYPGSALSEQAISQLPISPPSLPLSSAHPPLPPLPAKNSTAKKAAPAVPTPASRVKPLQPPRTFTFPMSPGARSPFILHSPFNKPCISEFKMEGQTNLFDDMDDAIDEVFLFALDQKKLSLIVDAQTLSVLPAAAYEPIQVLPSTTYNPKKESGRRSRKDSVLTSTASAKSSLPPVPAKDDKYLKPAITSS